MIVAIGWFVYKLYLSYSSAGGTDFMVPVYDAAMYPPVLAVVGLYLVLRAREITWSWWIYVAVWLGLTLLFAGALKIVEEMGDRSL
jgi:hypothetical protein